MKQSTLYWHEPSTSSPTVGGRKSIKLAAAVRKQTLALEATKNKQMWEPQSEPADGGKELSVRRC